MDETALATLQLKTLPDDDRIYRLFWAGELLPKSYDSETTRAVFWFQEHDENLNPLAKTLMRIEDAVGSIPHFILGSYWQNGRFRKGHTSQKNFEISVPDSVSEWQIVRAGDKRVGGKTASWIEYGDMILSMPGNIGGSSKGHEAHLVVAKSTKGEELLIPCYEIFRAYFAANSDLANQFVSRPFNSVLNDFTDKYEPDIRDEDGNAEQFISLRKSVSESAVLYLAGFLASPSAREAGSFIYPLLQHFRQVDQTSWLKLPMPFSGRRPIKLAVTFIYLAKTNSFLITRIGRSTYFGEEKKIRYAVPRLQLSKGEQKEEIADESAKEGDLIRVREGEIALVGAEDHRNTVRNTILPAELPQWDFEPLIVKQPTQLRLRPQSKITGVAQDNSTRTVSTGGASKTAYYPAGAFDGDEHRRIDAVFSPLYDLLQHMYVSRQIDSWASKPLVDPQPAPDSPYCALPVIQGRKQWVNIPKSNGRRRLAWLVQIEKGGKRLYWVEVAPVRKRELFCSLAVILKDGGELTKATAELLFSACVEKKGAWPTKAEGPYEIFAWRKLMHGALPRFTAAMVNRAFLALFPPKPSAARSGSEPLVAS